MELQIGSIWCTRRTCSSHSYKEQKNIPEIIVWLYFIQRTGIERNQKETLMGEQTLKRESRRMRRYINLLFSNMTLLDRIKFALLGNYHKPLLRTENKIEG